MKISEFVKILEKVKNDIVDLEVSYYDDGDLVNADITIENIAIVGEEYEWMVVIR